MILERLSGELGLPTHYIEGLIRSASHHYKSFKIPKHKGGSRLIHHPSKELKAVQRWLLDNVIAKFPLHRAAMAYRKAIRITDNARPHVKNAYLLRMDFVDFFPSIRALDIDAYMNARKKLFRSWTPDDREHFRLLVCRNERLTIGAPTSPSLSNAICFDLDERLSAAASEANCVYTRYADDIFFSTSSPDVLRTLEKVTEQCCSEVDVPRSLKINKKKTRHSSKKGGRRVTGITLGSDGEVYVGRYLKRRIRAMVHRFDDLDFEERAQLAGLIAYVIGFDREFLDSLILKYDLDRVEEARRHPLLAPRP